MALPIVDFATARFAYQAQPFSGLDGEGNAIDHPIGGCGIGDLEIVKLKQGHGNSEKSSPMVNQSTALFDKKHREIGGGDRLWLQT